MANGTAVATREAGAAINPYQIGGDLAQVYWASLPATTVAERAKLYALMTGAAEPLGNHLGEVIEVEHVIAHGVEIADEQTGEVREQPRVVLITPDGDAYQAVSWGVLKSLKMLAQMVSPPPFTPALRLKIQQLATRKGFRTYTLQPVDPDAPAPAPKSPRK